MISSASNPEGKAKFLRMSRTSLKIQSQGILWDWDHPDFCKAGATSEKVREILRFEKIVMF